MPTWLIVVVTYLLSALLRLFLGREKKIEHELDHLYPVADPQFARSMEGLLPPALVGGNRVTPLINGDAIFPAMLVAIRAAQHTITFETFIYWSGEIGKEFADALIDRARAGVKLHVLLDWLGSNKMDQKAIERMTDAGVEVHRYHPVRWYELHKFNNRTHRKLLIVDGRIGFTGGVGIADEWTGHAQDPDHWRDSHFQVEGPVVAQLQSAFMDNWLKVQNCVLHGPEYFPELHPQDGHEAGAMRAQVFVSSPAEGSESVRLMYLLSITCAARSVRLASAYFVPDDLSVATLVAARKRGVEVDIIVPGEHIDTQFVRRASRARWGKLLEAGVRIHEYAPTMYHCKVMVIDDLWTSVGSTNFDNRSFRLNDEANLNVLDETFAADQSARFEEDKARSKNVTLDAWQHRPWHEKLMEHAAALLRPLL
jgi:cardiolipin synthase